MEIRTSTLIRAEPGTLWPLLTGSQMTASGRFCLGVPRPVACELPDEEGGEGTERRCISDRGVVHQVITTWEPPSRLEFRMVSTDHGWARCVEAIEERFVLERVPAGTKIIRRTRLRAKGANRLARAAKETLFAIGLKRVHYYVFRNWRLQAEAHPPGA